MQAILPSVGARGTHAVHGTIVMPPPLPDDSEDPGKSESLPIPTNPIETVTLFEAASASSSKRKFSSLDLVSVDSSQPSSGLLHAMTSSAPSAPSAPSASSSKKQKNATTDVGKDTAVADAATRKPAKQSNKVTTAVAMVSMQGSINRMADVFEKSITTTEDVTMERKRAAIKAMQTLDDGLSVEEKANMIGIFTENVFVADAYLELSDVEVRRAWLRHQLLNM
jgi:hypothetical protein